MKPTRRLAITSRTVEQSRSAEYDTVWNELRAAVGAGARAWRYRSSERPLDYIEFIEYPTGEDPRFQAEVAACVARLGAIAPAETAEWIDATQPDLANLQRHDRP